MGRRVDGSERLQQHPVVPDLSATCGGAVGVRAGRGVFARRHGVRSRPRGARAAWHARLRELLLDTRRPARGRPLLPSRRGWQPHRAAVLVLGYGFWQRQFEGEPSAIGRTLTIGDDAVHHCRCRASRVHRRDERSRRRLGAADGQRHRRGVRGMVAQSSGVLAPASSPAFGTGLTPERGIGDRDGGAPRGRRSRWRVAAGDRDAEPQRAPRLGAAPQRRAPTAPTRRSPSCSARYRCSCC